MAAIFKSRIDPRTICTYLTGGSRSPNAENANPSGDANERSDLWVNGPGTVIATSEWLPRLVDIIVELRSLETPPKATLLRDLFECRGPWIFAMVSWIISDRELAQILVIETFWRASQNPRVSNLEPQALSVWLRLTARNLAIDSLRGQPPAVAHPAGFRSDYLDLDADLTRISLALLKLAPHEREVFELAYFEGLSHSEIAALTGRSLGTIKTWVRSSRLRVVTRSESVQMQNEPSGRISVQAHVANASID